MSMSGKSQFSTYPAGRSQSACAWPHDTGSASRHSAVVGAIPTMPVAHSCISFGLKGANRRRPAVLKVKKRVEADRILPVRVVRQ